MNKALLSQLGLGDREMAAYNIVVKYKKVTPSFVAMHTKITRPTVYNICKKLASQGLIIEDLGSKTLSFLPTPPEELRGLIRKDEEEVRAKGKLIDELADELALHKSAASYPVPRIRFIEQENILKFLYAQTETWNDSVLRGDGCWWGFQDHTFVERYGEWINWFWQNNPKQARLRVLSNSSPIEKVMEEKQYSLREIKYWKTKKPFSATTWVNGDYLVMAVSDKEPYYLVEIHDKRMSENFREVFKNLWSLV